MRWRPADRKRPGRWEHKKLDTQVECLGASDVAAEWNGRRRADVGIGPYGEDRKKNRLMKS